MEQLIPIKTDTAGKRTVSAKDLFIYLGYDRSQWARWYTTNIVNNPFGAEYVDWVGFDMMSNGNQTKDFEITIDFAKRLSMMAKTEKGEQARLYFLQCEQAASNPFINKSRAELLKEAYERELENEQLKSEIAVYKPKALFADAVNASTTCIGVGELAKIIKQNGIDTGEKRLFAWMRSNGYMMRRGKMNIATQYAMNLGLFEMKETPVVHNDGTTTLNLTPKVTGKGQTYFITKFFEQRA